MAKKNAVNPQYDEKVLEALEEALHEFSNQAKRVINLDITSEWLQGILSTADFYSTLLTIGFSNADIKQFADKLPLISKIAFGLLDTVGDILGKD